MAEGRVSESGGVQADRLRITKFPAPGVGSRANGAKRGRAPAHTNGATPTNGVTPSNGATPMAQPSHEAGTPATFQPEVSLVVPTRNEAGNIHELVRRLEKAMGSTPSELIFVDDSTDHTPEVIKMAGESSSLAVSLIRAPGAAPRGLAAAVRDGFSAARGRWVCVMDGDLQHPPELVPQMLRHAEETGAGVVVASRYLEGGKVLGLERGRSAISKAAIAAARFFFPFRLGKVTDPLTGFFMARRELVDITRLRPRGFKILLEILIRFPHVEVAELPFTFDQRYSGQSKAGVREAVRYLRLLFDLRLQETNWRALKFAATGASGIVVNQAAIAAFTDGAGFHYVLSAAFATVASSVWNFGLSEVWVFGGRSGNGSRWTRMAQFLGMNLGLLVVRAAPATPDFRPRVALPDFQPRHPPCLHVRPLPFCRQRDLG